MQRLRHRLRDRDPVMARGVSGVAFGDFFMEWETESYHVMLCLAVFNQVIVC